jgi:glycosyltransferase involved in cell wall biosynthesis
MKILYDGQIYSNQAAGGINRYFANIIGRLPQSFAPSLIVRDLPDLSFPAHPNLRIYKYGRLPLEHISWKLGRFCSLFEKRYHQHLGSSKRFDIIHPTYYSLVTGREIRKCRRPVVITVWDMIHELFPALIDPHGVYAEEKRNIIAAAQAIICISENTKKDLLERYKLPEGRVVVTHLASGIDASMGYGTEQVPARPYYLFVGSRARYKNFDRLLAAFANAVSAKNELSLCVVGAPFTDAERTLLAELRLTDRVEHYGFVNDDHLAKLYRCSLAFVYPSLYEGFGIPPLEAMSCGTVVVASNGSSIPEVVSDAGILFDPTSTDALTDILLALSSDSTLRERLRHKGQQRAKLFTWEKTVAATIAVYRSLQN